MTIECTKYVDAREDGVPVIARLGDCQTCFVCEAYCPADALYVSPLADELEHPDEQALDERGALGSWRAEIGWGVGRRPNMAERDMSHILKLDPSRAQQGIGRKSDFPPGDGEL